MVVVAVLAGVAQVVAKLQAVERALKQLTLDVQAVGIPTTNETMEQLEDRSPKMFSDVILEDPF